MLSSWWLSSTYEFWQETAYCDVFQDFLWDKVGTEQISFIKRENISIWLIMLIKDLCLSSIPSALSASDDSHQPVIDVLSVGKSGERAPFGLRDDPGHMQMDTVIFESHRGTHCGYFAGLLGNSLDLWHSIFILVSGTSSHDFPWLICRPIPCIISIP